MVPRIRAISSFLPSTRVDNRDLADRFGLSWDFVANKIGFTERSRCSPEETLAESCTQAFKNLQRSTPVDPKKIGLVCVVTQTPERRIPHSSARLHEIIGCEKHCITFDISQGCAGWVHGLDIVCGLLRMNRAEHALLFTCDLYSRVVNPNDKATALLFGDGATVTWISNDGSGFIVQDADFGTGPQSSEVITCNEFLQMDGREVFNHAMEYVPASIKRLLARNQLSLSDIEMIAAHQASHYLIESLRKALDVPAAAMPFLAAECGNTVSSSVPLVLESKLALVKQYALATGFGVGFTWGSALLKRV
jgi:3-oxoacyl-[acyl-carrier-protein] synthase III